MLPDASTEISVPVASALLPRPLTLMLVMAGAMASWPSAVAEAL
jgi:hypothetical protein